MGVYLQVIKLTDEEHLTQLAGRLPAMLSGYHLKETLRPGEALRETSANGPATNFMISPDRLSSNSMMVSTKKKEVFTTDVRAKKDQISTNVTFS